MPRSRHAISQRTTKRRPRAWANRRVLVTGAGGFIGSHLVEALVDEGATIRAFLRYNSRRQEGNLRFLDGTSRRRVECFYGDLRDLAAVRGAIKGIDTVFHLAASISIPYSYLHPTEVVETNVGGTLNILLAARETGMRRVILASTSEVYGTAQYVPIDERHPLGPQSPYAASKIGADMLGLSFHRTYGAPVTIVRPFNTYGPRQSMRAVIPTIITQALTQDVIRLGALHPTRDFLFVEDTVRAFLAAAVDDRAVGQIIHFGSGRSISIRKLAQLVITLVDRSIPIETAKDRLRPETSEVLRLQADSSDARRLLGWTPQVSLEDGLRCTIEWINKHLGEFQPMVYHT